MVNKKTPVETPVAAPETAVEAPVAEPVEEPTPAPTPASTARLERDLGLPMIYSCMEDCMRRIGAITKSSQMQATTAKGQKIGYAYRSIDAVYNALQPAMIEAGITVVPQVLDLQYIPKGQGEYNNIAIVKMSFRWYAADGSYVETVVYNQGMDSGDKAISKAMANAFKYACFMSFVIPTEEMDTYDPDHYRPEIEAEAAKGEAKAKAKSSLSDRVQAAAKAAEKAPAPEEFDRMGCINMAAAKVGYPQGLITPEARLEFGAMVAEVQKAGKAVNKKTGEMTPDELRACMREVVAMFGAAS